MSLPCLFVFLSHRTAIVDKQAELCASIAVVAKEVEDLPGRSFVVKVKNTVNKVLDPVKEQISRLTNIVAQLTKPSDIGTATSASAISSATTLATSDTGNGLVPLSESAGIASEANHRSSVNTDRLRNVAIFGTDDTRNSSK